MQTHLTYRLSKMHFIDHFIYFATLFLCLLIMNHACYAIKIIY